MKRFLSFLITAIILILMLCTVVACAGGSDYVGTYYAYDEDGVKDDTIWVKLEKDTWSDSSEDSGKLVFADGTLTGYIGEEAYFIGGVENGVLSVMVLGFPMQFYADGAYGAEINEPNDPNNPNNPPVQKTKYTVSFDSDGGSSVSSMQVEEGEKMTAPTQPTKDLFVFNGWYKEKSCKNVWNFDTETVTEDITLYAKWKAEEVRVSSVEGATIDGTNVLMLVNESKNYVDLSDMVIIGGDATWGLYYDMLGQRHIPTKIASGLDGELADGSNVFYIVVTSKDNTQSKTYKIDIFRKYEVSVSYYKLDNTLIENDTVITYNKTSAPTYNPYGYTLNGWKTSTGATWDFTEPVTSSMSLYPKCTANDYDVTYDTNGGTIAGGSEGKEVTFADEETFPIPTREGCTFNGWFVDDDQVTAKDGECASWFLAKDTTIKALWRHNNYSVAVNKNIDLAGNVVVNTNRTEITVFFDNNGVENASNMPEQQAISKSTALTYPSIPQASGKIFKGWYKDSACNNLADLSAPMSQDTTLYAGWHNIDEDDSILTLNGDAINHYTQYTDEYTYFVAQSSGTYKLYYKNSTSNTNYKTELSVYNASEYETVVSSSYKTNTSYQYVSIDVNKGDVYRITTSKYNNSATFYMYITGSAPTAGALLDSTAGGIFEYEENASITATTNNGYTWLGWYDGETKVSEGTSLTYTFDMPASNKTYTAKWYKLGVEKNISDAGTVTTLNGKYAVGDETTITAETNNGYTWLGWYDGETKVSEGTSLTYTFDMPASNKTYTAKWMECPITIEKNLESAGSISGVEGATALGASTTITAETNNGYTWLGWYDGETKVSEGTSLTYTFDMPANNKTYTAKWTFYEVSYELNGGTNHEDNIVGKFTAEDLTDDSFTLLDPSKVTNVEKTDTPPVSIGGGEYEIEQEVTEYTFLGWYSDSNFNTQVTELTIALGTATLYAKWSETTTTTTTTTQAYIRANKDNTTNANGDYILFGSYPQTIKADSVTIDESTTKTQGQFTYYKGDDNEWYAKVVADPYENSYKFSNNTSVTDGNTYYFKVEPIRWRILTENFNSTNNALILCDSIIQNKAYDDSSNNYANSEIRAWLNDQFYNSAFSGLQKALIQTTEVDNSVYSTGDSGNSYACSNTNDKIFLPSYREVVNSEYGFDSDYSEYDTARRMLTSDFSRASGVWYNDDSSYFGNGTWWLRSPGVSTSSSARRVSDDGYVYTYRNVSGTDRGVVPALVICLE